MPDSLPLALGVEPRIGLTNVGPFPTELRDKHRLGPETIITGGS